MADGDQEPRRRRTGSNPTVADVARAAGVSLMTVSRVINGSASVSEGTCARVRAAIARLGYVPNPAARSLAGARQHRIALLYANPSAAYLSEFLMGMLRAASIHTELIVEKHEAGEAVAAVVARVCRHRADAVVLPPPLCDDAALIEAFAGAGLRVVQVATGRPQPGADAVMIDDVAAARCMVEHLLGLGHRRIGFIAGASDQTASACRHEGYVQAMRAGGAAIPPEFSVAGDFTYRSGLMAAEQLLRAGVTAIFASNDDMAAAAVAAAHRRGLDVPGDLSIAGFDDSAMATTIWPELTTIRQPIAEMAGQAVTMVAAAAANPQASEAGHGRVVLPFSLVTRASTGVLRSP